MIIIMGSDPSKSLEQKHRMFDQMFGRNFQLLEQRVDEIFGSISVYQNKNTRRAEVILKSFAYSEEYEMSKLIENMRQRVLDPIPNLLSIYHLEEVKLTNAFCGSGIILKIYIEYLDKSLKEEMRKRRKHKNYFFSEEQLWKIFISLVNAVKHLHQLAIFHGEIRLENILIDGDYHMKLVERSLLNPSGWQIQLQKENVRLAKGQGTLFSPCILKCLFHQKTQIASYDPFKGDVWAIGMIMLECCSQKKAEDFYDYDKFTVKMKDIQVTIYELRKRYSWEIMNLIERMLQEEDEERIASADLYQKIRKIPNETIRELNMTLNQSFMNESIRSYM